MAPGIMHILFVHSDGFVIKEFHFLLPSVEGERERERERGGWGLGVEAGGGRRLGTIPSGGRSLQLQQKKSREGNPDGHADTHPCMEAGPSALYGPRSYNTEGSKKRRGVSLNTHGNKSLLLQITSKHSWCTMS